MKKGIALKTLEVITAATGSIPGKFIISFVCLALFILFFAIKVKQSMMTFAACAGIAFFFIGILLLVSAIKDFYKKRKGSR